MSELPNLSAQKPYALDQLAQLQGKIIQLSKSMVLQRARIERCLNHFRGTGHLRGTE